MEIYYDIIVNGLCAVFLEGVGAECYFRVLQETSRKVHGFDYFSLIHGLGKIIRKFFVGSRPVNIPVTSHIGRWHTRDHFIKWLAFFFPFNKKPTIWPAKTLRHSTWKKILADILCVISGDFASTVTELFHSACWDRTFMQYLITFCSDDHKQLAMSYAAHLCAILSR